jgi:hypothetical protein
VLKSREERRKKFLEVERRAQIATERLEEKERRRAEERELRLAGKDDGSEASDESDDFIVSDDDDEERREMGDEPEAASEMSKNVFETGVRYLSFDSIVTIAACFIISFLALCFNDA